MKTPVSSMLLVSLAALVGSFGAVFLKAGATRLELRLAALLSNWRLATGVALYLASSVLWVAGIRQGELTVLYPLSSLGYVYTMLWSRFFFGEKFTRNKFVGLALILCGVAMLGLANRV